MTMFEKKNVWPPGYPQCTKDPPLGHDPGDRIKIPSNILCISHLWEHKQIWYKNLWNWHGSRNLMIFDLWPHPKVTRMKILLAFCSACYPVDLIYHMTMFEKKNFLTPWAPPVPQSPTPGAWSRGQNENPFWYVLYLSIVRTHTKFGIKIFEIDFVIEIKWYLTFWPLPRAPGGGAKKKLTLHAPFMSVTHTPNLVEFRPMI